MAEFEVKIKQYVVFENTVFIEAENESEAYETAEEMFFNGEIELEEREGHEDNIVIEVEEC